MIFPDNFFGKYMFKLLFCFEKMFNNFFVNNFQYYYVVLKKKKLS
jgi:hypothetical protein